MQVEEWRKLYEELEKQQQRRHKRLGELQTYFEAYRNIQLALKALPSRLNKAEAQHFKGQEEAFRVEYNGIRVEFREAAKLMKRAEQEITALQSN